MKQTSPHAIVVGAGFTGCAVAHDLALRGVAVTVVERGDIASGTSGRTHGLLHSGGRYCANDRESAIECIEESGKMLHRMVKIISYIVDHRRNRAAVDQMPAGRPVAPGKCGEIFPRGNNLFSPGAAHRS